MRLLVVADIHYALKQYDWLVEVAGDFDALFIVGDLLEIASSVPLPAQVVVVRSYLEKLSGRTRVLVCSGNHDLTEPDAAGERVAHWIPPLGEIDVISDGAHTHIGDALVSVLPWWDGEGARERIGRQLEQAAALRTDGWIWLHHAPPSDSVTAWSGKRHYGDTYLRDWIGVYKPDAVFSGHVHQAPFVQNGSWVDLVDETWVFNMGQQPGDAPAHIIYDGAAQEAAWFSIAGAETVRLTAPPAPAPGLPDWIKAVDRPSVGAS